MIQVYILTYNRPELILRTLESVLKQDFVDFELIVSDNSTNNETEKIIGTGEYKGRKFKYVRRNPSLPWHDHYNTLLKEVTSDFFMFFHDDDIMHPNMVSELIKNISANPSVSAVAPNAFKVKNNKKCGLMRTGVTNVVNIQSRSEMAQTYLSNRGCAPFPGYMYRSSLTKEIFFDAKKGGRYCDVSFLMDVADKGLIVLLDTPLMDYYYHNSQISASDSFLDKVQLTQHIARTTTYAMQHSELKEYRLFSIYRELRARILTKSQPVAFSTFRKLICLSFKYSRDFILPRSLYLCFEAKLKRNR